MLFIFVLCGLASSISNRSLDPLITMIARDFDVPVATAALMSSAYAFPYAFSQPILGPIGDFYGKALVLRSCLWLMTACMLGIMIAPNFETMLTIRLIGGVAAGGIMPVTMALMGDRYPPNIRQLAIGRFLTAGLTGMVFGASVAGIMAVTIGWRSFILLAMCFSFVAAIGATFFLKLPAPPRTDHAHIRLSDAMAGYASIFANPKALLCFGTVFTEGLMFYGATPFIVSLLETAGQGTAREAGFVLGSIGIGGICFSLTLQWTLRLLKRTSMMSVGAVLLASGLVALALSLPWQALVAAFIVSGFGFMLLHNSIQAEVAELAPQNRASAFSTHSFSFFLGQAFGPIIAGFGLGEFGRPWLIVNIVVLVGAGLFAASRFRRHPTASGAF
jgi:predicted MFS family arabinose efflux permease